MRDYFYAIAEYLDSSMQGDEVYTAWFEGENSDIIRFNQGKVRQPGSVSDRSLTLDLIQGNRHALITMTLSGDSDSDRTILEHRISSLRQKLPLLEPDPYLLYNTTPTSTESFGDSTLPEATSAIEELLAAVAGLDFVGFYAGGTVARGFANSFGQRNWFEKASFNLDWSIYSQGDKAVKANYAGFEWDGDVLRDKLAGSVEQLDILKQPAKTIDPGIYSVYLAPAALRELFELLSWGGFGLKSQRTKRTPLLEMIEEGSNLHPMVSIKENTRDGAGPNFQTGGFIKPDRVDLIEAGRFANTLNAPRSAKEYGVKTNGANESEMPEALEMSPGELAVDNILKELDTGLYINNFWYLNYSDRASARITGMTRFATLWVENGRIQFPVNVMRFDETIYRMFGDNLSGLTRERELILDPDTWTGRSTKSMCLPGATISAFRLTG